MQKYKVILMNFRTVSEPASREFLEKFSKAYQLTLEAAREHIEARNGELYVFDDYKEAEEARLFLESLGGVAELVPVASGEEGELQQKPYPAGAKPPWTPPDVTPKKGLGASGVLLLILIILLNLLSLISMFFQVHYSHPAYFSAVTMHWLLLVFSNALGFAWFRAERDIRFGLAGFAGFILINSFVHLRCMFELFNKLAEVIGISFNVYRNVYFMPSSLLGLAGSFLIILGFWEYGKSRGAGFQSREGFRNALISYAIGLGVIYVSTVVRFYLDINFLWFLPFLYYVVFCAALFIHLPGLGMRIMGISGLLIMGVPVFLWRIQALFDFNMSGGSKLFFAAGAILLIIVFGLARRESLKASDIASAPGYKGTSMVAYVVLTASSLVLIFLAGAGAAVLGILELGKPEISKYILLAICPYHALAVISLLLGLIMGVIAIKRGLPWMLGTAGLLALAGGALHVPFLGVPAVIAGILAISGSGRTA